MDAIRVCGVISQRGMMTSRATPTGLPGHDQHVRLTAPTADERPGQERGDPGATPPNHHPRYTTSTRARSVTSNGRNTVRCLATTTRTVPCLSAIS